MEALLNRILKGDPYAVGLCLRVYQWANAYDDIVDADKECSTEVSRMRLHRAVTFFIHEAPSNPFFKDHRDILEPAIANAVSSWRIANTLQHGDNPKGHEIAHVLRWTPIEFFLTCARIVGGEDWVQQVGPWFWLEMTKAHSFEEFARECGG